MIEEIQAKLPSYAHCLPQWSSERHALRRTLGQTLSELAASRVRERQARYLANHDLLTALPNRGHFYERLDSALRPTAGPPPTIAVLYIDLDGFKTLNDTHGHRTGDALLRISAARMRHRVRAQDMVCRLGGDEFGCLLTDMPSRERIGQIAAGMFDAVSAPLRVGERMVETRPSIGIAISPADGASAEVLLHRADTAMYHAKQHRSRFAFYTDLS